MSEIPNGFTARNFSEPFRNPALSDHTHTEAPLPFSEEELSYHSKKNLRWSWVEVDLKAIRHNILQVKQQLRRPSTKVLAVVKADAYGHGAVPVAKMALSSGAEYLGVATVWEGIELREAGISAPILLLSEPPRTSIPLLLHHALEPSVYTPEFAIEYAEVADVHRLEAPFHLAINTGMNRIGVRHDEVMDFIKRISFHRALRIKGTFTHFATADAPEEYDFKLQFKRFCDALEQMHSAGVDPGIVHCDNSAALMRYAYTNLDMVRFGIGMYGIYPCAEARQFCTLKPAMSVHARITDVKQVPVSEGVSYGLNYRSPGSVKICTLPIGYADGLMRILSSTMSVIYEGVAYPQVGNICMDQCMFEINLRRGGTVARPNPQIGDEVLILGQEGSALITADDLARMAQTIPYEILCGFGKRMPRIYIS